MSEKKSFKKSYVLGLYIALSVQQETPRITFITSFGLVDGERAEIADYNVGNEDEFLKQFEERRQAGENVKFTDIAFAIADRLSHKEDLICDDEEYVIHLKNAKVVPSNGNVIESPELTLFLDQVIGVIPGHIS